MAGPVLDEMKTDALGEVYNIAMGSAAVAVGGMIDANVSISAPQVIDCKASEIVRTKLKQLVKGILFNKNEDSVYIKINYTSGIEGASVLVFNEEDMQMIVNKLMGMELDIDDDFEFDDMRLSAVTELMNQMMSSVATSLSQVLNTPVSISPPEARVSADTKTLYKMQEISASDEVCAISFDLEIDDAIDSRFIMLLPLELAEDMSNTLLGISPEDDEDEEEYEDDEYEDEEEYEEDEDFDSILSVEKRDAIGEIQNIMMGSSATSLSNLMNAKVWITTPQVKIDRANRFSFKDLDPSICVKINYIKGIHGTSVLVLKQSDVQMMVNQLMGMPPVVTDDFVFDELNVSAVCEIMNQMMGASATTLSEIINTPTDISTPEAVVIETDDDILSLNNIEGDDYACMVSFDLTIDGIMKSHFVTMLSIELANELADKVISSYSSELDSYSGSSDKSVDTEGEEEKEAAKPKKAKNKPASDTKAEEASRSGRTESKPAAKPSPPKPKSRVINNNSSAQRAINVQEYHIDSLAAEEPDPASFLTEKQYKNLNSLLDVPMDVTVVIGSTSKSIEEVGNFTKGTIIELDTLANEPVDIMVNGNLIARGDVVVVDDNFAIRITEIVN